MVCKVCGRKGHNVRGCALPGARLLLDAQAQLDKLNHAARSPQHGRKPPRLGTCSYGKRKLDARRAYSGPHQKKVVREKDKLRRQTEAPLPVCKDTQLEAVRELQGLGFLRKLPKRCLKCRALLGQFASRKEEEEGAGYLLVFKLSN